MPFLGPLPDVEMPRPEPERPFDGLLLIRVAQMQVHPVEPVPGRPSPGREPQAELPVRTRQEIFRVRDPAEQPPPEACQIRRIFRLKGHRQHHRTIAPTAPGPGGWFGYASPDGRVGWAAASVPLHGGAAEERPDSAEQGGC